LVDRQEIREARQLLGVTQVQLAQALGVTARSVINWEMGDVPISTVVALAIRHLLDQHEAAE
jgi:DNA-binding XRE family transcriptional regulator